MQFLEILSLLQKRGISSTIVGISFLSPKTRTIICNFYIFFLFFKNMDYHMQFLEFPSLLKKCGLSYSISRIFFKNMDYHMQFLYFLSLFQKRGQSYAFFEISFPSPKTWTIIWNF